jgi:Dehydrogenases with different specificities (related to short-chain alcohol dehydrogenases)
MTDNKRRNLTDQVIIVTGGNSGVGYGALVEFCAQGAQVIMASRNETKALEAIQLLKSTQPNAAVTYLPLNLNELKSIHEFVKTFTSKYDRLDVLVNNAGVMYGPLQSTVDGFEYQFGINHLGHFALTGLLLSMIKNTPGSRVVTVSSLAHRNGKIDFDNLQFQKPNSYSPQASYGRSKLANLLFGFELDRKFKEFNIDAQSIVVHPGVAKTNLFDQLASGPLQRRIFQLFEFFIQSAQMGALPTIEAAVNDSLIGGEYLGPDGFMEIKGQPKEAKASTASRSIHDAKLLWKLSEELTNVSFKL